MRSGADPGKHCTVSATDTGLASLTLAVWWALWSLADAHLLPYTPQVELLVLVGAVLPLSAHQLLRAPSVRRHRRYERKAPDPSPEAAPDGADALCE